MTVRNFAVGCVEYSKTHKAWCVFEYSTHPTLTRPRRALPSGVSMNPLSIRQDPCTLDFLALGALVNRLDPGVIPFRKARSVEIHVSGGEYNVAANLSDCFGLKTGIATAMINYGIGELVHARVG